MPSLFLNDTLMDHFALKPRKMTQRSFRIFQDQLDALRYLCEVKYRGRRNPSDLLRDCLDEFIEPQKRKAAND